MDESKINPRILYHIKKAGWYQGRCMPISLVKNGCNDFGIELFERAESFIKEFCDLNVSFFTRDVQSGTIHKYEHIFYSLSDDYIMSKNENINWIVSDILFDEDLEGDYIFRYNKKLEHFNIREKALVVGSVKDGIWLLIGESGKFYFATDEGDCFQKESIEEVFNFLETREYVDILLD